MRLEPYARDDTLAGGMRAEVHDPLWLLARQWQLGEFQGEDAGSPVDVRLELDCTRLTRYLPGGVPTSWQQDGVIRAGAATQGPPLPAGQPLEALVERERIRAEGTFQPRLATEAGLHFLRLLGVCGAAAQRAAVLERFPLQVPPEDPRRPLNAETRRFLAVTAGRVPDGGLLYSVLRTAGGASTSHLTDPYLSRVRDGAQRWQTWLQALSATDRANVNDAVAKWLGWHDVLFTQPGPAPDSSSWIPERMEYEALAAAPTPEGEVVLAAPEYTEGSLDWYDFNLLPAGALGATRAELTQDEQQPIARRAIPVPVTFRGMPAARWWEFEDARVDFGSVSAGPQELVRLLLLDFAIIYGNDWYVLPVVMPVGTLGRPRWLVVSDTFGERTLIRSARFVDGDQAGSSVPLPWDLFRLSPDRRPFAGSGRPLPDCLFLPPALGTSLNGAPLEEVLLLRDELANVAWAVERIVESPTGRAIYRSEAFFRSRQQATNGASAGAAPADGTEPLVYRLATDAPDHWVPLLPVRPVADDPSLRLLRSGAPWGRILEPERDTATPPRPLRLNEEEVPRAGARVTRAFQYTRWTGGQTYLWIGRRKGAGRGEGSSGLQFDVLEPAHPMGV